MDDLELNSEELEALSGLPKEYWPCPLMLITLLVAHAEGRIHHKKAFEALMNSGLVSTWVGHPEMVTTTEMGRKFVEMLEATPLPEQRWIDPRSPAEPAGNQ